MAPRDESGDRNNFTIIPNFIFWLGLSPHALVLYGHIKQTAGEEGYCNKSTQTLAAETSMSAGMVSSAKAELLKHELIRIDEEPSKQGVKARHWVTILDVWHRNDMAVQLRKSLRSHSEQANSQYEIPNSEYELANSECEINKNLRTNKNQREEERKEDSDAKPASLVSSNPPPNINQIWEDLPSASESKVSAPDLPEPSLAVKEFFRNAGRKRWATPAQKELFETTESEVGPERMMSAVVWAMQNGIVRVPAICTAAKRGKRDSVTRRSGDEHPPPKRQRQGETLSAGSRMHAPGNRDESLPPGARETGRA